MKTKFRAAILVALAVFALFLGALFALPVYKKDFAHVELGRLRLLAEVVSDPEGRSKGLADRSTLPEFGGMLFTFDAPDYYGIWMKGMRFPVDIFWLKNGVIVDKEESAPPPRFGTPDSLLPVYRPDVPAQFVLETRAGMAKKYGLGIGDSVKIFYSKETALVSTGATVKNQTPDTVGAKYFIETLRNTPAQGRDFKIEKFMARTKIYRKFQISYRSGGLTISGVMNVPLGKPPEGGWPVLILNHGLISPEIYYTGRGSRREQDFFARHGYATIHSDYRGLADSSPNAETHHDFYVGYTEDVVNLIDAIKSLNSQLLDAKHIGMWGHSMGGGIASRVMVLRPDVRAYVLFAPISADVEDNFYELKPEEVAWLRETYGLGGELYKKMSPLNYFVEVQAPVQLHHASTDKDVPVEFSEKMYEALKANGKKVEFYKYPGEGHEFGEAWPLAAERALQFFDKYVKSR